MPDSPWMRLRALLYEHVAERYSDEIIQLVGDIVNAQRRRTE